MALQVVFVEQGLPTNILSDAQALLLNLLQTNEINSILSIYNIPIKFIEKPCNTKPYWIVELPNESSLRKIASRSVSIKNCIELWSRAKTKDQLHINLKRALENDSIVWKNTVNKKEDISDCDVCPKKLITQCVSADQSFKILVETFCKHFTMKEKVAKIEKFSYLPLEGPVKLKNPDITLMYLEYYGVDPNNIPEEPCDLFFGKWIVDGQRDMINIHSLKKRQFIGNTSMDAQLSLLMANQARIVPGDLVLDPFVGSGSILVAAAHFGGYVWGSDIDYMMLHGRTRPTRVGQKIRSKDESILSNMYHYGIGHRYMDVLVSDFSLPLWRDDFQLDAIITDPPYGVREPTEKIGIEKENYSLTDEHLLNHYPAKVEYGLPQIYSDLLNFSAKHLRKGKRLVCWYPLVREDYDENNLPSHPCMTLVANSEQILSKYTSRRLLTFEKFHDYEPHMSNKAEATNGQNFREKYFSFGEITRRERKEKRDGDLAAYALKLSVNENNVT